MASMYWVFPTLYMTNHDILAIPTHVPTTQIKRIAYVSDVLFKGLCESLALHLAPLIGGRTFKSKALLGGLGGDYVVLNYQKRVHLSPYPPKVVC